MVRGGVAPDIIVKSIAQSAVQFQLLPENLIALKTAGVPDDIVRAMEARSHERTTFRIVPFSSSEAQVASKKRGRNATRPVPAGSKIYVEAADGFDTYLTAALQQKKVAVVLAGVSDQQKAGWARIVIGQVHADEQAGVKLVNRKSNEVVFAYAVNKRNSIHGRQTAAEACAKHMKEVVARE